MERYLTINAGQVAGLLGAAEPELRTAILLASAAGLRTGEMSELKWTDVDLDRDVLHVQRYLFKKHHQIPIHPILNKQLRLLRWWAPSGDAVFPMPEVQTRLRNKLHGLNGHFVGGNEIHFQDLRAWFRSKVRDASIERGTPCEWHRSGDSQNSIEEMRAIIIRALSFVSDWSPSHE
jgi:integrase